MPPIKRAANVRLRFRIFAVAFALFFWVSGPLHELLAACHQPGVEHTESHSEGEEHQPCSCPCHFGHSAMVDFTPAAFDVVLTVASDATITVERPADAPPVGIEHPPQLA